MRCREVALLFDFRKLWSHQPVTLPASGIHLSPAVKNCCLPLSNKRGLLLLRVSQWVALRVFRWEASDERAPRKPGGCTQFKEVLFGHGFNQQKLKNFRIGVKPFEAHQQRTQKQCYFPLSGSECFAVKERRCSAEQDFGIQFYYTVERFKAVPVWGLGFQPMQNSTSDIVKWPV